MRILLPLALAICIALTASTLRSPGDVSHTRAASGAHREAVRSLQQNPLGPIAWQSVEDSVGSGEGLREMGQAIFAPGTPSAYMEMRRARLTGTSRFVPRDRWAPDEFFKGVSLTYSFPPDGTNITGGDIYNVAGETNPNERVNHLHARFNAFFGDVSLWKTMFRNAYDDIEAITGLRFEEVADDGAIWPTSDGPLSGASGRGDLRIVSAIDDGPFNVLAFNFFPEFGGDMLIDSGDLQSAIFGDFLDDYQKFRNIITHETGHGVGLFHSCPINETKIMEPFVTDSLIGPQADDRLGLQHWYGDRFELGAGNDTWLTATTMAEAGLVVDGSNRFVRDLSINAFTDVDAFQIDAPGGSYVDATVTVAPLFLSYLAGPQNSNGTCSPGSSFNTSTRADLRVVVRDLETNAIEIFDEKIAGQSEVVEFSMIAGESVTVEIEADPGATFLGIQGYNLTVRLKKQPHPYDLSLDGCIDGTDLAFVISQWGDTGIFVPADLTGDNMVDGRDIAAILAAWAPCP